MTSKTTIAVTWLDCWH